MERVRLGLEPDVALKRLKELAKSPLAEAINEEMHEEMIRQGKSYRSSLPDPARPKSNSLWELEDNYRRASALFKRGLYVQALDIIAQGLSEQPEAGVLLRLKRRIQYAMQAPESTSDVTFREVKPYVEKLVPAEARVRINALYPVIAKKTLISGDVLVEVRITKSGDVEFAHAFRGPRELRQAAAEAASRWRFYPASRDGRDAEYSETIVFHFLASPYPSINAQRELPWDVT